MQAVLDPIGDASKDATRWPVSFCDRMVVELIGVAFAAQMLKLTGLPSVDQRMMKSLGCRGRTTAQVAVEMSDQHAIESIR